MCSVILCQCWPWLSHVETITCYGEVLLSCKQGTQRLQIHNSCQDVQLLQCWLFHSQSLAPSWHEESQEKSHFSKKFLGSCLAFHPKRLRAAVAPFEVPGAKSLSSFKLVELQRQKSSWSMASCIANQGNAFSIIQRQVCAVARQPQAKCQLRRSNLMIFSPQSGWGLFKMYHIWHSKTGPRSWGSVAPGKNERWRVKVLGCKDMSGRLLDLTQAGPQLSSFHASLTNLGLFFAPNVALKKKLFSATQHQTGPVQVSTKVLKVSSEVTSAATLAKHCFNSKKAKTIQTKALAFHAGWQHWP